MDLDYNIISLIDTLGLLQGVILGSLLIIVNKKKDRSTVFLGLFILVYSIELLPVILDDLGVTQTYLILEYLPLNFSCLLFPLFYVYVQQISIFSRSKISYWVLIPGSCFFVCNTIVFFIPSKHIIFDSLWYLLLDLLGMCYGIYIGFKTYLWIKKHRKEVGNQYSAIEFKELRWAQFFVIFGLLFTIVVLISNFFETETSFYFNLIISVINIALLYWVSIRGIMQQDIMSVNYDHDEFAPSKSVVQINSEKDLTTYNDLETKDLPSKSELNKVHADDELLQKLQEYIVKEKLYTKPELTITDLANCLSEHPKKISSIINSKLNQNFNTYINSFRVEQSIKLLKSDAAGHLSVEGIAHEVGFKSRSSFYSAFKKVTGTTPTKYKAA